MYTSKLFTQSVSLWDASVVSPMALLLFGGAVEGDTPGLHHDDGTIDDEGAVTMQQGWITFEGDRRALRCALRLRACMARLLDAKLQRPDVDVTAAAQPLYAAVLDLLRSSATLADMPTASLSEGLRAERNVEQLEMMAGRR